MKTRLVAILVFTIFVLCACNNTDIPKVDESSYIGQIYTIETYPYTYKESLKLLELYQKLKSESPELILVEGDTKLFSDVYYYKKTLYTSGSAPYYYYYGELKEDKPHGKGILLSKENDVYYPSYIGEFSEGYFSGHGIVYLLTLPSANENYFYQIEYEGEFAKGQKQGIGCQYYSRSEAVNQMAKHAIGEELGVSMAEKTEETILAVIEKIESAESIYGTEISKDNFYSDYPLIYVGKNMEGEWKSGEASGNVSVYEINNSLYAKGEFKDGLPHGKVKIYYEFTDIPKYEGEMKSGKYHGKGTLYFENGQIEYEGEFKNHQYSGKGTLYNEEGTILHKGTFKNGNVA